jgi:hypothetical protein
MLISDYYARRSATLNVILSFPESSGALLIDAIGVKEDAGQEFLRFGFGPESWFPLGRVRAKK